MTDLLTAALEYAAKGWPVFPLHARTATGCSCGTPGCDEPAMHPMVDLDRATSATTEPSQIRAWWGQWPAANIGVRTGGQGPTVISADSAQAADGFRRFREAAGAPGPKTLHAQGLGVNQLYFASRPGIASCLGRLPFDVLAEDGYVVAPPSADAAGGRYTVCSDTTEVEPLPHWLVELLETAFPVEAFPAPLARYVREVAASLVCPTDLVAVPLLCALGTAVGATRVLELKGDWIEAPRIFTAVVAPPGAKKSPALKCATRGLALRQAELQSVRSGSNGDSRRLTLQVMTTDTTTEALAAVLADNPRGVAVVADELSGWIRSMDQYKRGRGADRQRWLSFWNGAQVIINRRGLPSPIALSSPFVCLTGCLPPDVLGELADDRGREDGFLDRLLFSFPVDQVSGWTDNTISAEAERAHDVLFEQLWALESGPDGPVRVRFTGAGKAAWIEWVSAHYSEQKHLNEDKRGPWAKLDARLILILHCARQAAGDTGDDVDEDTVARAATLIGYFKSHIGRVQDARRKIPYLREPRSGQMLTWLKNHGGQASIRDLVTNKVAGCATAPVAEAAARDLEIAGAVSIEVVAPRGGGRPSLIVKVREADAA